jgi:hypothetical protein
LPAVLYGSETWTVTLTEEHRLRVSENRVPMKMFGPTRDETIGSWRKLHKEGFRKFYPSPNTYNYM